MNPGKKAKLLTIAALLVLAGCSDASTEDRTPAQNDTPQDKDAIDLSNGQTVWCDVVERVTNGWVCTNWDGDALHYRFVLDVGEGLT